MSRDDFSQSVKDTVARRAGYRCSKPTCRTQTVGPHSNASKAINVGTAAHITAAAPGGPRFDSSLTAEKRKSADNAIWLCGTHAREVDSDTTRFTVEELQSLKASAERETQESVGQPPPLSTDAASVGRASLRDQRISTLTHDYNSIGTEGVVGRIATFDDLDQNEKAEMFDTVRALARGGRKPRNNPFRSSG